MITRVGLAALALLMVGSVTSCGPQSDGPSHVALRFYAAIGDHDGDGACAVLAPTVAEAVAGDEGTTCAAAITSGEIGDDLIARSQDLATDGARVAGRQAQVRLGADTVFLARSGGSWVVTGAGCDARPERPYDCEVTS